MASLTPLSVEEFQEFLRAAGAALTETADLERSDALKALRSLHEAMTRLTRGVAVPPTDVLRSVAALVASVDPEWTDALAPRQRVVYRLLRDGGHDAAWEVLIDNGTGLVNEAYDGSTATGADRTSWRLPLLTTIEESTVFAELPGFRDPRYAMADDCYDITEAVQLHYQLEELAIVDATIVLGGWARLDVLTASDAERLTLTMVNGDDVVSVAAERLRRPDFVTGRSDGVTRQAWSGWSARIELASLLTPIGEWSLKLGIDHDGVCRRGPLGRDLGELAKAATRAVATVEGHPIRWIVRRRQLILDVG